MVAQSNSKVYELVEVSNGIATVMLFSDKRRSLDEYDKQLAKHPTAVSAGGLYAWDKNWSISLTTDRVI